MNRREAMLRSRPRRIKPHWSFQTFQSAAILLLLVACFPQRNQSLNLSNERQIEEQEQDPRPIITDILKQLKNKAAAELTQIAQSGPLEEKDLVFLFGAATTLEQQRIEIDAKLLLFFARDADPFFDAYCAQQATNPQALASAKRFFLNMDLYRDRKALLKHLEIQGVTPGKSMIWIDTGYGGSNFSYLLQELVELGARQVPPITPIQIVFPILPFLVSSSGKPSWERDMGLLRESDGNFRSFINDVFYPEILIPEDKERVFQSLGGNRKELVEKLENKELIQKWEYRPERWKNGTPLLIAKDPEKRRQALAWQTQIAARALLQQQHSQ
jgi:hypothetical protein